MNFEFLNQVYSIQQYTMEKKANLKVSVMLWNVVIPSELQVLYDWVPLGSCAN